MADLKRRAESLCEKSSLDEDKKLEVQQTAGGAAEQWRMVLEAAEDAHRCCTTFLTFSCLLPTQVDDGPLASSLPSVFCYPPGS